jgi:hypothetical protein
MCRELGADHRRGAPAVIDHDLLAQALRERFVDRARDQIRGAAGRIRHD